MRLHAGALQTPQESFHWKLSNGEKSPVASKTRTRVSIAPGFRARRSTDWTNSWAVYVNYIIKYPLWRQLKSFHSRFKVSRVYWALLTQSCRSEINRLPHRGIQSSSESTHTEVNQRSKYVKQVQQQRHESPTVTLFCHACKYKVLGWSLFTRMPGESYRRRLRSIFLY